MLKSPPSSSKPFAPELKGAAAVPFQPQAFNPAQDLGKQILGDSGSSEVLRLLQAQTDHIKRADTLILVREALLAFKRGDWETGGEAALKALHVDEKSGQAWHILAIAREKAGDLASALTCFETALKLMPDDVGIINDLGRLAYRLELNDLAEKFFKKFLESEPNHPEAVNNLASVMREANRLDEAIEILRTAIGVHPENPQLWNALGTVVNARGDLANAAVFYNETLRHDPRHVHGHYNLGNALLNMGDIKGAREHLEIALPIFMDAVNINTCKLSIAFTYLAEGDLRPGWEWYQARDKDGTNAKVQYLIDIPQWKTGEPVKGKRIFVAAEQGLGDEIMFAGTIRELIAEVGPDGHVAIGVEPRLVPLFARSFPDCTVVKHHTTLYKTRPVTLFPDVTDWSQYDCWAIMGQFLGRYRNSVADFARTGVFLTPDPERVAYWQAQLAALNGKPKIGVLWKSLINHSRRNRYYSPFEQWKDIIAVEGVQFVNLQYGDVSEELAEAKRLGLDIWTPPGIDLKQDLDDLAALCAAMDCVLGPANATSNIAGAVGTEIWIISPVGAWNSLGTDRFPWYEKSRVFFTASMVDWGPVMAEVRQAVIDTYTGDKATRVA